MTSKARCSLVLWFVGFLSPTPVLILVIWIENAGIDLHGIVSAYDILYFLPALICGGAITFAPYGWVDKVYLFASTLGGLVIQSIVLGLISIVWTGFPAR